MAQYTASTVVELQALCQVNVTECNVAQVEDFLNASLLVSDHCEGVDLNCGCPQGWACKEGVGACLIEKPEFLSDLVKQARNRCKNNLSVSIKMRVHGDLKK